MILHLEKKAIRTLAVAESFRKEDEYSTLAGVVMRSDLVIDGFALGTLKVSGSDATDSIVDIFEKLGRNDVNVVFLSGSVLSLYNVVDVDLLHVTLKLPIVAITFKRSRSDLELNIKKRFSDIEAKKKIALLEKLGTPVELALATGYKVYIRTAGMRKEAAKRLLDKFTLQGALPEPVRVAKLLARTAATIRKLK